jgi:truncated hemoglobin YjbI
VETQPSSLYDRLGGIYSIATVVDDFIDRIIVDDRLTANPPDVIRDAPFRRETAARAVITSSAPPA